MNKPEKVFIFRPLGFIEHLFNIGVCLSVVISWGVNKSILWAVLHGCCGWFYVLYYALGR